MVASPAHSTDITAEQAAADTAAIVARLRERLPQFEPRSGAQGLLTAYLGGQILHVRVDAHSMASIQLDGDLSAPAMYWDTELDGPVSDQIAAVFGLVSRAADEIRRRVRALEAVADLLTGRPR